MRIAHHDALRKEVIARLYDDQSPEAIAGHLGRYRADLPLTSKDSIYRFIKSPQGRRVETYRWLKRQRRRRRPGYAKRLSNRTFIDKRPDRINTRSRVGDAEADFIVSGKSGRGILLTVADRKLRVSFLEQIIRVSIRAVHEAFLRIRQRFPELKTATTDNDLLFERHKELEELLRIKMYFCHPYHSWEKGTIENVNKVIRRDIPKGSDISRYSKIFIRKLEQKLNRRPMRVLGYRTPQEALAAHWRRRKTKKHRERGCPN